MNCVLCVSVCYECISSFRCSQQLFICVFYRMCGWPLQTWLYARQITRFSGCYCHTIFDTFGRSFHSSQRQSVVVEEVLLTCFWCCVRSFMMDHRHINVVIAGPVSLQSTLECQACVKQIKVIHCDLSSVCTLIMSTSCSLRCLLRGYQVSVQQESSQPNREGLVGLL